MSFVHVEDIINAFIKFLKDKNQLVSSCLVVLTLQKPYWLSFKERERERVGEDLLLSLSHFDYSVKCNPYLFPFF